MNYITLFLWAFFVFLLSISIGMLVNHVNTYIQEGFGMTCLDYIPFTKFAKKNIKKDTIFVSVASYRDEECSNTLDTIFNKAQYPDRIFVGICEQNKKGLIKENCINLRLLKYKNNIKIIKLDYKNAKGPTYARYHCANLWNGEEYFLQIDSHTTFLENWDTDLINMIKQIKSDPNESNRPVLSVYPPAKEQMEIPGFPEMDSGNITASMIPTFLSGWSVDDSSKPLRSNKPWAAAGFMFLESYFLYDIPYDPNLSHLFQLEEVLFSARLFTNGWDFYTPNKKIAYHNYKRSKSPLYHKDIKDGQECRGNAEKRGLFILGIIPKMSVADGFLVNYNNYGLGNFRSITDFWNASGIDFENKTIEKWNDANKESSNYDGWNFRRSGYQNILKYTKV